MTQYGIILYHRLLSLECARVRRTIRRLGLQVDLREVVLSRRHRDELRQLVGVVQVPCLVISGTVVCQADEIQKYLRLRYGERPSSDAPG